jgi:hypothetical protein
MSDWWSNDPVAGSNAGGDFWANDPVAEEKSGGLARGAAYSTQGINRAISDTLGAPVDLANAGLRAIGVPTSEEPLLGSKNIRGGLNRTLSWAKKQLGLGDPEFKAAYDDINDVPEPYRPAVRAGEVTGATLTGMLPIAAAARGKSLYDAGRMAEPVVSGAFKTPQNIWRGMVSEAATNPSSLTTKMLPVTAGTAAAAAGAEAVFPGSETAQLLAQLGGGFAGAAASASGQAAANRGGSLLQRLTEPFTTKTEEGLKSAAGRALGPKLAEVGESPDAIIARLEAGQVAPGRVAVDRAQSPLLTGAADTLAKDNPNLANAITKGRQTYEGNLQTGTSAAFEPGNVSALSRTAAAREGDFNRMISGFIDDAETRAQQALTAAGPATGQTKAALSLRARNVIEQAVSRARNVESRLWGRIPGNLPARMTNTNGTLTEVRSEMLDEQQLPTIIENAITRLVSPNANPTFRDLKNLRTEMLNQARSLRSGATPDFAMARRMDQLAGGVLDDMAALNHPGIDPARAYSRALNDRLTRSFAGEMMGTKGNGMDKVRPELTLDAATTGSKERVASQLGEMQTAAAPVRPDGSVRFGAAPVQEMRGNVEQYLRLNAERALQSGNARTIERFIAENQTTLDQFPQFRAQLTQAAASQTALDDMLATTDRLRTQVNKTAGFARVLKAGEDPSRAVGEALSGNTPVQAMRELTSLARAGGADAIGGLRAAVLKHVTDSATSGDTYSFAKATQLLHAPLSPNGPSLLKSMRDNGILNATQYARIGQHLDAGLANEVSKVTGLKVGSLGNDPGMWLEAAARVVGAKVATATGAGAGGSGNSLQAAQLGANIAKKMLGSMPKDRMRAFLADAMASDDPATLISILERSAASAVPPGKSLSTYNMRGLTALRTILLPADQTEPVWEDAPQSPQALSITITPRSGAYPALR